MLNIITHNIPNVSNDFTQLLFYRYCSLFSFIFLVFFHQVPFTLSNQSTVVYCFNHCDCYIAICLSNSLFKHNTLSHGPLKVVLFNIYSI